MWGIWIKYLYWSVSYDKISYYFRCHLRRFCCLDKHPWKAISEDWAQCWLHVLLWTPGGAEYHVAETAQLLVVRKQRGRDKERVSALGILQRNAQCLCFSYQASISTGIFKCLFKFWIQQGVKLLIRSLPSRSDHLWKCPCRQSQGSAPLVSEASLHPIKVEWTRHLCVCYPCRYFSSAAPSSSPSSFLETRFLTDLRLDTRLGQLAMHLGICSASLALEWQVHAAMPSVFLFIYGV